MGISGLLPVLKSISNSRHISAYRGQRVAVDGFSWLHKGAYCCSQELCQGLYTDKFVRYCMSRIDLLVQNGVQPIVVFDGGRLPSKAEEEESRRSSRRENKEKALAHLAAGNTSSAIECFQRAINITSCMAKQFIEALKEKNIDFIVAPYEADAQLTYLALNGYVHAVITEDSDLLVYGCPRILFKLDKFGNGEEILLQDLVINQGLSFVGFTHDMFIMTGIMSGCDFLPSLQGIGIKKAHQNIKKYRDFVKVCKSLRFKGNISIPKDYEHRFQRAIWVFKHQRVYCPLAKALVHVRPIPQGGIGAADVWYMSAVPQGDEALSLDFLGPMMDDTLAQGIAQGDIDPSTKLPFDLDAIFKGYQPSTGGRTSSQGVCLSKGLSVLQETCRQGTTDPRHSGSLSHASSSHLTVQPTGLRHGPSSKSGGSIHKYFPSVTPQQPYKTQPLDKVGLVPRHDQHRDKQAPLLVLSCNTTVSTQRPQGLRPPSTSERHNMQGPLNSSRLNGTAAPWVVKGLVKKGLSMGKGVSTKGKQQTSKGLGHGAVPRSFFSGHRQSNPKPLADDIKKRVPEEDVGQPGSGCIEDLPVMGYVSEGPNSTWQVGESLDLDERFPVSPDKCPNQRKDHQGIEHSIASQQISKVCDDVYTARPAHQFGADFGRPMRAIEALEQSSLSQSWLSHPLSENDQQEKCRTLESTRSFSSLPLSFGSPCLVPDHEFYQDPERGGTPTSMKKRRRNTMDYETAGKSEAAYDRGVVPSVHHALQVNNDNDTAAALKRTLGRMRDSLEPILHSHPKQCDVISPQQQAATLGRRLGSAQRPQAFSMFAIRKQQGEGSKVLNDRGLSHYVGEQPHESRREDTSREHRDSESGLIHDTRHISRYGVLASATLDNLESILACDVVEGEHLEEVATGGWTKKINNSLAKMPFKPPRKAVGKEPQTLEGKKSIKSSFAQFAFAKS